jgi:Polysaccharide lyase
MATKISKAAAFVFALSAGWQVHAADTVLLKESFDSFSNGQALVSGVKSANSLVTWRDRNGDVTVSTDKDYSGTAGGKSLKFHYPAGSHEAEQRIDLNGQYPELWFSYKVFVPKNYVYASQSNNKFLMVYNDFTGNTTFMDFETWAQADSSGNMDGTNFIAVQYKVNGTNLDFAWGPTSTIANSFNVGGHSYRFIDPAVDNGKWISVVFHLKLSSCSTCKNGASEVWKNGEKIVEVLNVNNFNTTANHFSGLYLLGWANTGYASDTTFYIDDFTVSQNPLPIDGGVGKVPSPPTAVTVQ